MSFFVSYILLFILFNINEAMYCPSSYNLILNGCYKINNSTQMTWSNASQYCIDDSKSITTNKTGFITHLLALESTYETTSLLFWMKAWAIQSDFWTDGVALTSSWSWSNQSIIWYFNANEQEIYGNGSNYRLIYNSIQNNYQIGDANNNQILNFICEYQDLCNTNNSCQNNATCYLNFGRELCICLQGYTGTICDQQIDECLSSPCQHGGKCTDSLNNYTCDCSDLFFTGSNCEIPMADPTQSQRSAAFWTVFGILCSLVALLTLSDLPWEQIANAIGCPWYRFKCCSNQDDDEEEEDENINNLRSSDTLNNENNIISAPISMRNTSSSSKGMNYQVMNTIWNPEQLPNEIPSNSQYNGYQTPINQQTTPNNILIKSFATVVLAKHKAKEIEAKRIYAVDINESNDKSSTRKTPADTMITWTQQLQEQLKHKQTRPTSASSTKELITNENENQ